MTEADKWLMSNQDTSYNYSFLVNLIRSGKTIDAVLTFNGISKVAQVVYLKSSWGGLELFKFKFDDDEFTCSRESEFLFDCAKFNLVFAVPYDPLKDIKKLCEIAKNSAEFKAVSVPLNTVEEVDALLALMGVENATERQ